MDGEGRAAALPLLSAVRGICVLSRRTPLLLSRLVTLPGQLLLRVGQVSSPLNIRGSTKRSSRHDQGGISHCATSFSGILYTSVTGLVDTSDTHGR